MHRDSGPARVLRWLIVNGPATAEQISDFLQRDMADRFAGNVANRLCRHGLAHVTSRVASPVTGRMINEYAVGPGP